MPPRVSLAVRSAAAAACHSRAADADEDLIKSVGRRTVFLFRDDDDDIDDRYKQ